MNLLIVVLLFGAAVAAGALLLARGPRTLDQKTLARLRQAGADLSKPHDIEHWLYFPTREGADLAAAQMQEQGFSIQSVSLSPQRWEVLARIGMIPERKAVAATTALLESIAAAHGGRYDGWGTEVVK